MSGTDQPRQRDYLAQPPWLPIQDLQSEARHFFREHVLRKCHCLVVVDLLPIGDALQKVQRARPAYDRPMIHATS